MTSPAIDLQAVTCKLGRFRLGPVDLIVPRGSIFALIGPNGAGKTTLLDRVMGLGRADSGAISVLGLSQPKDEVAIKAKTAYVNPDVSFAAWGKVGRALDFVSGFYPDWDDDRCTALLAEFDLRRSDGIGALSFGARIKLSLVMALSRDAELLLLDEPTVGLDVAARRALFTKLLEIIRREERTVVISSHQLDDLERIADHVAVLNKGKMIASGPMDQLLGRYRQLDAVLTVDMAGAMPEGVRLLARDGHHVRLLVDRTLITAADLQAMGVRVEAEVPMTLEDLFVALTSQ